MNDEAREALAVFDALPRHGDDPDHCAVCYGSCDPSPDMPESPADQAGTTGTENHEDGSVNRG